MHTALTIAGSDSGGGGGIQADLKTFAALGVYGASAITAVTAQNTVVVRAVQALPRDMVKAQIDAVCTDIDVHAVKTGMLANAAIVEAVADALASLALRNVVVDPVMVAKSGDLLLESNAVEAIRTRLLKRALVVTPNRMEAEVLTGFSVQTLEDARLAARRIHAFGCGAVVIKGGHLSTDDAVDVLFDGEHFLEFAAPRIESRHTHGTGCTFASAITAHLALGQSVADAVREAKSYVTGAIRHGLAIGRGHGPLDHFWKIRHEAGPDVA